MLKIAVVDNPTIICRPSPRTSKISTYLKLPETSHWPTFFRWQYGSTFIQNFLVGSEKCIYSAVECTSAIQDICDFLLVIHSNHGSILHRFWDMVTYWLKIVSFCYPSLIWRPCYLHSFRNFAVKLTMRKRVMRLSSSEDRMIVARVIWHYSRLWRTDRQTESIIASTELCITSYADVLQKLSNTSWLNSIANTIRYLKGFKAQYVKVWYTANRLHLITNQDSFIQHSC